MGTSATVFRVLMYSVWLGNPGKMLSTVHWNRRKEKGSEENALRDKQWGPVVSLSQEKLVFFFFFPLFLHPRRCWHRTAHPTTTLQPRNSLQSPGWSPPAAAASLVLSAPALGRGVR